MGTPIGPAFRNMAIAVLLGFLAGALVGSSMGIASGGTARNGWLVFGIMGGVLSALLLLAFAPRVNNSTDSAALFVPKRVHQGGEAVSSLADISDALERHLKSSHGLEREIRFLEFMVRYDWAVRNFSPLELYDAFGQGIAKREIEKALALADSLNRP